MKCDRFVIRVGRRTFSSDSKDEVSFGFRNVKKEEKQGLVGEVFSRVAQNYDRMNDAMSLGIHRAWKDEFVRMLGPFPGMRCLDLAGGTGDISFRIVESIRSAKHSMYQQYGVRQVPSSEVILSDINPDMLEVGRERASQLGYLQEDSDPKVTIRTIDAQNIDLEDNSVDSVTIAYGIRNCTDISQVLRESRRVLKKGGRFMCLEFSEVTAPLLREAYDVWSFRVIPEIGRVVAGDAASYEYLVQSIRKFPPQETFASMLRDAGLEEVTYTNLMFGVTAIHSGFKLKD